MKKFLIVGSGGRESAFAKKLIEDSILFAVIAHKNPTIIECSQKSGGKYLIGDTNDGKLISNFAKENQIDYVFVSADDPLANGVIDVLLNDKIKAVGGTKQANRIEWDKIYSIQMMEKVCPEFTPFYVVISHKNQLDAAIEQFKTKNLEIVVKPQGLTGGKGVKVMPEHLNTYQDCYDYALDLLDKNLKNKVLLVEKLHGLEFTIMGITDGENLLMSPASYDYPFRLEDDLGAGTGGMGCFTDKDKKLPFMTDKDFFDCQFIMQSIIDEIKKQNLFFNGVLNGGFFKTANGIKFMEFNSRFGDPEGLNILSILKSSFSKLIESLWHKTLDESIIEFIDQSSVIKYLVAKEYPNPSKEVIDFKVDQQAIESMGVNLYFASCVKSSKGQDCYETLKKSRVLALGTTAKNIADASELINQVIEKYVIGDLEYRADIGSKQSLAKIEQINKSL